MCAQTQWTASRDKLSELCEKARADCPQLEDLIQNIQSKSEVRFAKALGELRQKLLTILNIENKAATEYTCEMASLLKKLFLTLKGYDKATLTLTAEYVELMKRVKSSKGITWSDKDVETDSQFKFISNLDIEQPKEFSFMRKDDANATVDIVTDSDDLTDHENKEPVRVPKRKGTPIKLPNNETIIINDSLEMLDTTRNQNSAKKIKREFGAGEDVENYAILDPKDLNSTFVLAGEIEAFKKPFKMEPIKEVKRGLTDRTNTMNPTHRPTQPSIQFNGDKG